MLRRLFGAGVVAGVVGLSACVQPASQAACDATHPCPSGQLCDTGTGLCALPSAPFIRVETPTTGAVLSGTSFHVRGAVSSAEGAPLTAELSLGPGETWAPLALDGHGAFEAQLPLPALDHQPLRVRVRARNEGRASLATVYPTVDNVGPRATLLLPSGERRSAAVAFSEPLAPGDVPVSLLPAAPRSRANADRTLFEFAPLEPDTMYRLTLEPGAARDLAGNPGTGTLSTFFLTSPAVPDPGTVLAFEGPPVHDFEVAFDEDGVLSVAAVLGEPAQAVGWGVFSPRTGRFESLAVPFAAGLRSVRLVAGLAGDGVMPPKRTFGLALERQRPGGTGLLRTAFWRLGDGAVQSLEGALAVVPKPGGCNENAPDTVGLAVLGGSGALYRRAGRSDEAIAAGFLPRTVEARSPDSWEWFQDEGGVLRRQLRACACGGGCGFTVPELVRTDLHPADPELSLAAPRANGRLYVFNDARNARVEACYECGVGGTGTGACTLVGEQPGSVIEDLRVTSAKDGGRVLGARRREGTVELLERDLSRGCAGGWTVLAAPAEAANAVRFRPVRVGQRVGLLYLSPEDLALRLWLR